MRWWISPHALVHWLAIGSINGMGHMGDNVRRTQVPFIFEEDDVIAPMFLSTFHENLLKPTREHATTRPQ